MSAGMFRLAAGFRVVVASLALVALCPPAAAGQKPTLGEVASKEAQRRKAAETSQKVLTNKDLPPSAVVPLPPPRAEEKAEQDPKPEPPQPAEEPEEKDEAWWRARITRAREALGRNEVLLEALQSRVNALSTDFVSRDDPFQRARIGEDRQKALAEMERVRAETEALKKQIEDIQEEARTAGVPPGWLR